MMRSLVPWGKTPPQPLDMFRREVDSLFNQFLGSDGDRTMPLTFWPSTSLAETQDGYEVTVELPGLQAEDVNVELKDGELWISGEKKEEHEDKGKNYYHIERRFGHFHRSIPLPGTMDADGVQAEYKDGILKIQVPKSEHAKPRRIEVKS